MTDDNIHCGNDDPLAESERRSREHSSWRCTAYEGKETLGWLSKRSMPCLNCRRGHRDLYDCDPRVMRAAQHESCDHNDNERRRSSSTSRSTDGSRLRRLPKIRIRSSWLCLFYLLSFTTNWNAGPHSACVTPWSQSVILAYALEQGVVDQHETEEVERIRQRNTTAEQLFFPAVGVAPTAEKVPPKKEKLTLNQILYRAGKRGLGGGIPGAIAGAIQVLSLMWLRTIINYQCRYGTTFSQALRTLLHDGGVPRLVSYFVDKEDVKHWNVSSSV